METPALAGLIRPVEVDYFFVEHWERRPLFVANDDGTRFNHLLTMEMFDHLLCCTGLRAPAFRVLTAAMEGETSGAQLGGQVLAGELIDVVMVTDAFSRGATIRLQGMHHLHGPTVLYCRALEHELGLAVHANAYLTPPHAQGLPLHHDTHDVFVLQIHGVKRWRLSEPVVDLPVGDQPFSSAVPMPGQELIEDIELEPGDLMYLPRGYLHQAITGESDSLHLTIGVNAYTWIDALHAAVDACMEDLEFRRLVPADGVGADKLLPSLAQELKPETVAAGMRKSLLTRRRPVLPGQLAQIRAVAELTMDDHVECRHTTLREWQFGPDGPRLLLEGRTVRFPKKLEPTLRFVASAHGCFRVADLPGDLDHIERLVLVRRLVREGLLCIVTAGP